MAVSYGVKAFSRYLYKTDICSHSISGLVP